MQSRPSFVRVITLAAVTALAACGAAQSAPAPSPGNETTASTGSTEPAPAFEVDADGYCCCWTESSAAGDEELGPAPDASPASPAECAEYGGSCHGSADCSDP